MKKSRKPRKQRSQEDCVHYEVIRNNIGVCIHCGRRKDYNALQEERSIYPEKEVSMKQSYRKYLLSKEGTDG